MQRRRSTRALVLLFTLLLGGFLVVTTAPAANASAANRLATLRVVSQHATHGLAVVHRTTHSDHESARAHPHHADVCLPPLSGQQAGDFNCSREPVAALRAPELAPKNTVDDRAPPADS